MIRRSQLCRDPGKWSSWVQPAVGINLVCLKNRNKELSFSPRLIANMAGMTDYSLSFFSFWLPKSCIFSSHPWPLV